MRFEGKLAGMERRASYRSWDVYRAWILHRSGFDDAVQGWKSERERKNRGSKDDVAYYPVEHLSPVLRYVLVPPSPFSSASRARESVWKRARTLRHRRRPNCTTSAYYPSLNYSPLTTKIAPRLPQTLSSSTPQDPSLSFLHRYIFSVNAAWLIVSTASRVYWIVINKIC